MHEDANFHDLHEDALRGPFRVHLQELVEGAELMRNPFHVVQPVDAEYDLFTFHKKEYLASSHLWAVKCAMLGCTQNWKLFPIPCGPRTARLGWPSGPARLAL